MQKPSDFDINEFVALTIKLREYVKSSDFDIKKQVRLLVSPVVSELVKVNDQTAEDLATEAIAEIIDSVSAEFKNESQVRSDLLASTYEFIKSRH